MENGKNIWDTYDFDAPREKGAYEMLLTQAESLLIASKGLLGMTVQVVDSFLDTTPPSAILAFPLYVVAVELGGYRKKVLTVVEYKDRPAFPVDIHCHLDDTEIKGVTKEQFLLIVSEVLARPSVKATIQNLYRQSVEKIAQSSQRQNRAS
jgi:hypothetical protein